MQCEVKFLSLSQGSVVPGLCGQCNWNTSMNVLFNSGMKKVFLENFNQEVNFSSLVRYFTIIIYFLLPFPSYFNLICMLYNNIQLSLSLLYVSTSVNKLVILLRLVAFWLSSLSISKSFPKVLFVFGWNPWDCTLLLTLWIHLWCWCISNTFRTQVL